MIPAIAIGLAKDLILPEILKALKRDDVPVSSSQAVSVANKIAAEVAPVIVNQANAEPWYQSRVILGSLVTVGVGLAGLFGMVISPDDAALITSVAVSAGAVISGLFTLYGRLVAKKPLGQ